MVILGLVYGIGFSILIADALTKGAIQKYVTKLWTPNDTSQMV